MADKTGDTDGIPSDESQDATKAAFLVSTKAQEPMFIRVVMLEICRNPKCSLIRFRNPHLLITLKATALVNGNAIAISYAWGQFDRRAVSIGHKPDGSPVQMELGQEWDVRDFICTLATMGAKAEGGVAQAYWIDQLCIAQTQEAIRFSLGKIPDIFHTLDVMALMPGSLCGCMKQSLDGVVGKLAAGTEYETKLAQATSEQIDKAMTRVSGCLNAYGPGSYFNRMWTRQEFTYSRQIRLVWTSDVEAPCVSRPSDGDSLAASEVMRLHPLLRMLHESHTHEHPGDSIGALGVVRRCLFLSIANMNVLDSHTKSWPYQDTYIAWQLGQRRQLMLGHWMHGRLPRYDVKDYGVFSKVLSFLDDLKLVAAGVRCATKPEDYVLSVWVDCPGYEIPPNYRSLTASELLEDAIIQLEENFGIIIPVTCPYGLLDNGIRHHRSFHWRPSQYLKTASIVDSVHMYGPIIQLSRPFQLASNGLLALHFNSTLSLSHKFPLSWQASSYETLFKNQTTADAFDFMHNVVSQWPESYLVSLERDPSRPSDAEYQFRKWLSLSCSCEHNTYRNVYPEWGNMPEIDHESFVYRIVTEALGLDYHACRGRGLHVAVIEAPRRTPLKAPMDLLDSEVGPCIGLAKHDYGKAKSWWRSDMKLDGGVKTIFLRGKNDNKLPLIETVRVGESEDGLPTYEVIGVWMPMRRLPYAAVGGFLPLVRDETTQGYLV